MLMGYGRYFLGLAGLAAPAFNPAPQNTGNTPTATTPSTTNAPIATAQNGNDTPPALKNE